MKHQNRFVQHDEQEIHRLFTESAMCLLLTHDQNHQPHTGVFNPVLIEGTLYLHLHQRDEQITTLQQHPTCHLIFQDILSTIPSHWVDARDAGKATNYYRFADLTCHARFLSPEDSIPILAKMMQHYQPEGQYQPLDYQDPLYHNIVKNSIHVVAFDQQAIQAKWKLGQNYDVPKRMQLIEQLKNRAQGNDLRTVDEMLHWIHTEKSNHAV